MNTAMSTELKNDRQIAVWLLACSVLIFFMVMLGGYTRLTQSGLSMVEWGPIMGVVPPVSETEWQETFDKYKQFPEYQKINRSMDLEEFKSIFIVEYAHRMLGRLIGLVFLIPFIYFLIVKKIRRSLTPELAAMFFLGGLQGLLGWYMVQSGLVDNPHVTQYRLTAHLIAAVVIYGYILWVALGLLLPVRINSDAVGISGLRRFAWIVTGLIVLMIASGGFVAGTRAGFAFNQFPLMGDSFFPPAMFVLQPFYLNFFENTGTVQFNHRILAYILIITISWLWWRSLKVALSQRTRLALNLFLVMLAIQISLGITTLLLHVPVPLGVAHQGGALLLLTIALFVNHELRRAAIKAG